MLVSSSVSLGASTGGLKLNERGSELAAGRLLNGNTGLKANFTGVASLCLKSGTVFSAVVHSPKDS